jgi:hypothetical protein
MAEGRKSNKSKKGRKIGRNKDKCARYAAEHRRTRNNTERTQRTPERTPHRFR